jgi:hypothetical protein
MSQLHLTDEILMAFADGELEEPVAAAVAKAMSEDPVVAKRIVEFQQSRRLTRSFFSSALATDVPSELHDAVAAQIRDFEGAKSSGDERPSTGPKHREPRQESSFRRMALAASVAAVAAGVGYFAGQYKAERSAGLMARLEDPLVQKVLSGNPSGSEAELPTGRMRVISTYRLADGSLCREFKLTGSVGVAEAVACRSREWRVTLALANSAPNAEYVPSGGDDMVAAYLQNVGAGQPLVDAAEVKALAESSR